VSSRSDYLEYGGADLAGNVDRAGALEYLKSLGYGSGELQQARAALAERRVDTFTFDSLGSRYCDFCFDRIMGGEHEVLKDGRDRCSRCSRSALSTHEQFVDEYQQVRVNMELAFGIDLSVPLTVRMVNARDIARQTGETFVATGGVDPRVLGFARVKNGRHELVIENGSPRHAAITTMAHELTHIWQFKNWSGSQISAQYGRKNHLVVYEGMSCWAQVQYLFYTREIDYAQRQHAYLLQRQDEYGDGYRIYIERYPLNVDGDVWDESPFTNAMPL
jgi:hypothetical protein